MFTVLHVYFGPVWRLMDKQNGKARCAAAALAHVHSLKETTRVKGGHITVPHRPEIHKVKILFLLQDLTGAVLFHQSDRGFRVYRD